MQAPSNKILAEIIPEEKSTLILTADGKRSSVRAKVVSVGTSIGDWINKDDEIVVFNVYPQQIMKYEDKELIFVVEEEGFFIRL